MPRSQRCELALSGRLVPFFFCGHPVSRYQWLWWPDRNWLWPFAVSSAVHFGETDSHQLQPRKRPKPHTERYKNGGGGYQQTTEQTSRKPVFCRPVGHPRGLGQTGLHLDQVGRYRGRQHDGNHEQSSRLKSGCHRSQRQSWLENSHASRAFWLPILPTAPTVRWPAKSRLIDARRPSLGYAATTAAHVTQEDQQTTRQRRNQRGE